MNNKWTFKVFFLTFFLALLFSVITNYFGNLHYIVLIICIVFIVMIGIIFDLIGVAVLSCDKKVLHSKASQKLKGAKAAIKLVNNSSKVSSFCNDVVGDVCGIISGSLVVILIFKLFQNNISLINIIITCVISAITVGGKAIGKSIAVKKANDIVYNVGVFLALFGKDK